MALTANRVAYRIDVSKAAPRFVAAVAAVPNPVQFTVEQLDDKPVLCHRLNALQGEMAAITRAQRSHPEQGPMTFDEVPCDASGTPVVILKHNLGHFAEYIVTKWKGAAVVSGPSLVCDEGDAAPLTDANTLVLRSYVAGIASIRVF